MATTWNPSDKSASVVLSNGNLTATSNADAVFGGVRGTLAISSGKIYFEQTHTTTNFADTWMGVAPTSKILAQTGGTSCAVVNGWVGNIQIGNTTTITSIGDFASGDVLCIALDLTNQRIWFRRNNGNWNNSGTANPATNTGGFDVSALFTSAAAYPFLCNGYTYKTSTLNAGASAFAQAIPSGFSSWDSFDAPVGPPAAAGSTYGYVGNASGASRGRMIRKRKKGELDDIDVDELVKPSTGGFSIGRQRY